MTSPTSAPPGPRSHPGASPARPGLVTRTHRGAAIASVLDDVVALQGRVLADWPWLRRPDPDGLRRALTAWQAEASAIVVTAETEDGAIVGAGSGIRLDRADPAIASSFALTDLPPDQTFYMGVAVVLADWRGLGAGHALYALRERHARALGLRWAIFGTVLRESDHPLRPEDARSDDRLWFGRGYRPLLGVVATYRWQDVDADRETGHRMQIWVRDLTVP